ncbi:protein FD-like [Canna indica]|uniref:Protein FD-like n=1 Tax=Canna indica TaxID=4628 RepID=A0AAQ3JZ93_9LILI|nr:protein FD-like [Canna indica]
MWSSDQQQHMNTRNMMSSSSSSRSSPSSNSSVLVPQAPTAKRRTMEELWKDINLTTLHQDHRSYHRFPGDGSSPSFRNIILQDFLAKPVNQALAISPPAVEEHYPPPKSALSLNSGLEFQFLAPDYANSHSSSSPNASFVSSALSAAVAGPPSPSGLFSLCSKRRLLPDNTTTGVDRHHKRMIKNRESAARSRARKQAKTQTAIYL